MSMICILVASDLKVDDSMFKTKVKEEVRKIGIGVFFNDINDLELLSLDNNGYYVACSFADSYVYNNCEGLFLPDNCWVNDYTNLIPFKHRMELISIVIESIMNMCRHVELYIGETGANAIEDFIFCELNLSDFALFMVDKFNCYEFNAFRIHLLKIEVPIA